MNDAVRLAALRQVAKLALGTAFGGCGGAVMPNPPPVNDVAATDAVMSDTMPPRSPTSLRATHRYNHPARP